MKEQISSKSTDFNGKIIRKHHESLQDLSFTTFKQIIKEKSSANFPTSTDKFELYKTADLQTNHQLFQNFEEPHDSTQKYEHFEVHESRVSDDLEGLKEYDFINDSVNTCNSIIKGSNKSKKTQQPNKFNEQSTSSNPQTLDNSLKESISNSNEIESEILFLTKGEKSLKCLLKETLKENKLLRQQIKKIQQDKNDQETNVGIRANIENDESKFHEIILNQSEEINYLKQECAKLNDKIKNLDKFFNSEFIKNTSIITTLKNQLIKCEEENKLIHQENDFLEKQQEEYKIKKSSENLKLINLKLENTGMPENIIPQRNMDFCATNIKNHCDV